MTQVVAASKRKMRSGESRCILKIQPTLYPEKSERDQDEFLSEQLDVRSWHQLGYRKLWLEQIWGKDWSLVLDLIIS